MTIPTLQIQNYMIHVAVLRNCCLDVGRVFVFPGKRVAGSLVSTEEEASGFSIEQPRLRD